MTYLIGLTNGEEVVKTFYNTIGTQTLREFIITNKVAYYKRVK